MENIWSFLHIVGTVFGAGSVTTAYWRELYFKKHPEEISKRGSLPVITPMLNAAFLILILSGFGLYLAHPEDYNNSPGFVFKIVAVIILLLNHVAINAYIRPRRESMIMLSKISDSISLFGWYVIIWLSVI